MRPTSIALLLPLSLLAAVVTGCSEYDLKRGAEVEEPEDTSAPPVRPPDPENPDIRVEPDSIDFEYVPAGCDAAEEVTVSNVGAADLTVSAISLGGSDGAHFRLEGAESELVLAPGEAATFEVVFTPPDDAARTADITVSSDDPDTPEAGVGLEGIGANGGTYEEIFHQEAFAQVDILWVLDNSGSMSDALDHVYENFSLFIDPFLSIGLDFRMGVITTDMNNPSHSGRLQGPQLWITGDSPDPEAQFLEVIQQGSGGSGEERGMDAIQAALTDPLLSGENNNFMREDAHLATIVVTDEDDDSTVSSSSFASWYMGLKDDPDMVTFSAFCGEAPIGCFEWVSWSDGMITAEHGKDYLDAIDRIGGTWASICSDDFSDALSLLSLEASGLKDTFVLAAVPTSIGDMEVLVNGAEVRYDNVDGWQFDWGLNAVIFYGAAIPPNEAVIEVTYPFEGGC